MSTHNEIVAKVIRQKAYLHKCEIKRLNVIYACRLYSPIHASANYFAVPLCALMVEHADGWAISSWISFRQKFRCFTEFRRYSVSAKQFAFA